MLKQLEAAGSEIERTFPLNIAFHDRLVELTGNKTLLGFYRQIINRMHLLRRRSSAGGAASHAEHRRILRALTTRDPQAAGEAMRAHVQNGFKRLRTAADTTQTSLPRQRRVRS